MGAKVLIAQLTAAKSNLEVRVGDASTTIAQLMVEQDALRSVLSKSHEALALAHGSIFRGIAADYGTALRRARGSHDFTSLELAQTNLALADDLAEICAESIRLQQQRSTINARANVADKEAENVLDITTETAAAGERSTTSGHITAGSNTASENNTPASPPPPVTTATIGENMARRYLRTASSITSVPNSIITPSISNPATDGRVPWLLRGCTNCSDSPLRDL